MVQNKVGIWGFGIVGKSVLTHIMPFAKEICIMDKTINENDPAIHDAQKHINISMTQQTPENIIKFLEQCDIIIPSPGIVLHGYEKYAHKFCYELDLFTQNFTGNIIAITGTVGKTTITTLISQCIANAIAAGNIGHAMLDTLKLSPSPHTVVLELSSYQLHYAKKFAPNLAIWNNFYPNHLDHHATIEEYFEAKCNILRNQRADQKSLIALELINDIEKTIHLQSQVFLFSVQKPTNSTKYPLFYIHNNNVVLQENNKETIIFKQLDQLPEITFEQNWLTVIAALYLQNIDIDSILEHVQTFTPQQHRVEFVRNYNGIDVYNDSKSTVWQATQHAVQRFQHKKIALFLGGLSKGADRSPLITFLQNKQITVFCFGKEAMLLADICKEYTVPHTAAATLQEAIDKCIAIQDQFEVLLFSPAGSSFDLFKNYEDRGTHFKKIIQNL